MYLSQPAKKNTENWINSYHFDSYRSQIYDLKWWRSKADVRTKIAGRFVKSVDITGEDGVRATVHTFMTTSVNFVSSQKEPLFSKTNIQAGSHTKYLNSN